MQGTEYLASRSHEAAIEGLSAAICDNAALLALTGEPGSGKTTVLRRLGEELTGTVKAVYCPASGLDFTQILNVVCSDLKIPFQGPVRRSELDAITRAIAASPLAPVAVLVDDADRLHGDALDQLLRLVRAIRRFRGQFHLVLSGLPALQERLKRASASHPVAAEAVFARLTRLTQGQATALLENLATRRLGAGDPQVRAAALHKMSELGEGVPGKLVTMFDAALKRARQSGEAALSAETVERAAAAQGASLVDTAFVGQAPPGRAHDNERRDPDGSSQTSTARAAAGLLSKPRQAPVALGALAMFTAAAVALGLYSNAKSPHGTAEPRPAGDALVAAIERAPGVGATPAPVVMADPSPATSAVRDADDRGVPGAPERPAAASDSVRVERGNGLATAPGRSPEPRPSLSSGEVRRNLDRAWEALRRNALTTPPRDNAVHWATTVRAVDPGEAEAIDILRAVIDKYLQWADANLQRHDTREAARYLDRAQSLEAHASPDQVAAIKVLGSEVAAQQRRVVGNTSRGTRQAQPRKHPPAGPKWLQDIERWVEALPLPR